MVNTEVEKQMQELHKVPLTLLENPNMVQVSDNWIKIGALNVRGYLSHISDIKKDPYVNKLDVICFTETHLHPDNNLAPNVLPRGYDVFRFDQDEAHLQGNITQGGGVMILAKDLLQAVSKDAVIPNGLECRCVLLSLLGAEKKLCITLIYRPPQLTTQRFKILLEQLMTKIPKSKFPTAVMGDFNDNQVKDTNSPILSYMNRIGFRQLIRRPTTDNGSLLDHIYFNWKTADFKVDVIDTYYSDHDLVVISINKKTLI